MTHRFLPFAAVAAFVLVHAAHAGDPAVTCESGKLKTTGKYASCLLGADSKAVKKNTSPDYSKCNSKFSVKWQTTELKGAGQCPGGAGDQTSVSGFIDECEQAVADALAGGALVDGPQTCSDNLADCLASTAGAQPLQTGQTTCYDTSGGVIACAGTGQDGELQKGVARSFTDNGDGTVTDNATGLMWEKLSDDGSIHDKDTTYTWTNAFATKVATLNSGSFAGHNDWRVPNVTELLTLVNFGAVLPATYSAFHNGCAAACTVLTCSCTQSNFYWSSSSSQNLPSYAWGVRFNAGDTYANGKTNGNYVRAVRAGS